APVVIDAGAVAFARPAQSRLPLRARDAAPEPESGGASGALDAWASPRFFAGLSYVGQIHKTYLVCETPDELVLVDQHAAHERVAYGRLRAAHAKRQMPRQQLLFPIPIEVDPAE